MARSIPSPCDSGRGHGALDVLKTRVVAEQQARAAAAAQGHRGFGQRRAAGRSRSARSAASRTDCGSSSWISRPGRSEPSTSASSAEGPSSARRSTAACIRSEAGSPSVGEHVHEPAHGERGGSESRPRRAKARDGLLVGGGRLPVAIAQQKSALPQPGRIRSRSRASGPASSRAAAKWRSAAATSRRSARSPARMRAPIVGSTSDVGLLRVAGGTGEVERGDVVVGEDLGELVACSPAAASSQSAAALCLRARTLRGSSPVRHVASQGVPEEVLRLAFDGRRRPPASPGQGRRAPPWLRRRRPHRTRRPSPRRRARRSRR